MTVGYDSTWFCNILATGLQCAWTLLGNTRHTGACSLNRVCVHSPAASVCERDRGVLTYVATIVFITPGERSQICLYVCRTARMSACACICVRVGMRHILRMCALFITFLVCVGKPKPNRTVGYTRCSPQPVHRPSQTENWEGWGPNYTWWEKRMLRLFPALCVQCVYSDRVCVGECNGCVACVFLLLGPLWARAASTVAGSLRSIINSI